MFDRSRSRATHAITQPLAVPSTTHFAPSPRLQQRAEHLATTLPWEACRTLVEAAAPVLFEHPRSLRAHRSADPTDRRVAHP